MTATQWPRGSGSGSRRSGARPALVSTLRGAAPVLEALATDPALVHSEHHIAGHRILKIDLAPGEIPPRPRHRRIGRHLRKAATELFS